MTAKDRKQSSSKKNEDVEMTDASSAEKKSQQDKKKKEEESLIPEEEDLSEEDQQLKDQLEMLVDRLKEKKKDLYEPTLKTMISIIRSATSSMTSVPKPLKFLRPHFDTLKGIYESFQASQAKVCCMRILC